MASLKPRRERQPTRRASCDTSDDAKVYVRAILDLPIDQRDVFLLRRMKGMTYDEIGRRLNMTPEIVEANLVAGLIQMVAAVRSAKA